jgi:hypothetical protein
METQPGASLKARLQADKRFVRHRQNAVPGPAFRKKPGQFCIVTGGQLR